MKKTIGGDRLGSGAKMQVDLRTYERSTHDLGYIWRSTMASGTLVPFMSKVALPGDTFDISLECDVKTHPTIGPLFGSYKVQLDTFVCPIRLYNSYLHNNKLNIGKKMSDIKLPMMLLTADKEAPVTENAQVNPSSILAYLGVRGIGRYTGTGSGIIQRYFNAVPFLAYWDCYKNYYANKQEEIGVVIHKAIPTVDDVVNEIKVYRADGSFFTLPEGAPGVDEGVETGDYMEIIYGTNPPPGDEDVIIYGHVNTGADHYYPYDLYETSTDTGTSIVWSGVRPHRISNYVHWDYPSPGPQPATPPSLITFPLENIDTVRENLLATAGNTNFIINKDTIAPYGYPFMYNSNGITTAVQTQEGLAIKTYQSDLFNNWMNSEWIDGPNGVSEVTKISTTSGGFTIDALNLANKVYNMLNRIAISGGTYNDWIETVYTTDRYRNGEIPMYMGGLIKELVFQEVIANSAAETETQGAQPLGQLAGRGVMGHKHKGGTVQIKVNEPSYILGIVSLTPRVDYSQGNSWDMLLNNIDAFHKPALDEIGYQDLIIEQMAWWDTTVSGSGEIVMHSAGKQPAWVNYMTSVNKTYGNFAIPENEMFMTLNRRYEIDPANKSVKDVTTYIDPSKFNFIFAETALDAQNFWVQIGVDITARRKMSAKIMPNL